MPSPHPRPRDPGRSLGLVIALCLLISACSGSAGETEPFSDPPPRPPTSEPASDLQLVATVAAGERLRRLLAGDLVVGNPTLLDWETVERQTLPPGFAKDEFCRSLETPRADDVLTELLAVGLSAIARRRGGGSLSDESKFVLGLAVKFSIATCPSWKPTLLPVSTMPSAPVPPAPGGFVALPDDPSTSWRLVPVAETRCPAGYAPCWQAQVSARNGCPNLVEVSISVTDSAGAPLGQATASMPSVAPGGTEDLFFKAYDATDLARVYSVTCY